MKVNLGAKSQINSGENGCNKYYGERTPCVVNDGQIPEIMCTLHSENGQPILLKINVVLPST